MATRIATRFEAVRDQLNSAVRVYFLWDDLVSAVTLAGAAERVLSDLQPQDGIFGVDAHSVRSFINLHIKDEHQKEAAVLFRRDYDFLRHADRKNAENCELKDSSVVWLIFLSICSFEFLKQSKSIEMRAFVWWFMATHPQYLKADAPNLSTIVKLREQIVDIAKRDYYLAFIAACDGYNPFGVKLDGDELHQPQIVVRAPKS
jgi:hypothetical protein